jgi:hypothetical protein
MVKSSNCSPSHDLKLLQFVIFFDSWFFSCLWRNRSCGNGPRLSLVLSVFGKIVSAETIQLSSVERRPLGDSVISPNHEK